MDLSNASSHYENLLNTVTDLRKDLERTSGKLQSLEDQNQTLNNHYNLIKDELLETRKKLSLVNEAYIKTCEEKVSIERNHDNYIKKIKSELLEKSKQIEIFHDKLIPHDIDHLRIKVQEELEIQHKQELKVLENQIEIQQEKYYSLKREFDRSKAEFSTLIHNQQQEIVALRLEKEELNNLLREQQNAALPIDSNPALEEKVRSQSAKINELTHLVDNLRDELRLKTQDHDTANYNLEQNRVKYDQQVSSLKTSIALLESDKSGLQEKVNKMQLENEKKDANIRSIKASIEEINDRLDQAVREKIEAERQLSLAKVDHKNAIETLEESTEMKIKDYEENIEGLIIKLNEKDDLLRRTQREISEVQLRAETSEHEIRRTLTAKYNELKKKYAAVELELSDKKKKIVSLEEQLIAKVDQFNIETDLKTAQANRLKIENNMLSSKIKEIENYNDNYKKKFNDLTLEHTTKIANYEVIIKDLKSQISTLEYQINLLKKSNLNLENEKKELDNNYYRLEQKYRDLIVQTDVMKSDFNAQLESLAPRYKEKTNELVKQLQSTLLKEKKKKEAYKAKALEVHSKIKTLRSNNNNLSD